MCRNPVGFILNPPRDTCAAKLYVFILEMGYSRYGSQVLPDEGAQNTCTRAVQDAYTADSYQDSVSMK